MTFPTGNDRYVGSTYEMELAAHAVLKQRRAMAKVVREVSGNRADCVEPRPLLKAVEQVVPDEHGELDVGKCITFSDSKRAEHQRGNHTLVFVASLTDALDHSLLKHRRLSLPLNIQISGTQCAMTAAMPCGGSVLGE